MIQFIETRIGWVLILEIVYFAFVVLLSAKIIMDTRTVSKTLAYLLVIIFLPVIGIIVYFFFGVNYRKNRFFKFKVKLDKEVYLPIKERILNLHHLAVNEIPEVIEDSKETVNFLFNDSMSPLTANNHVELLINGEEKFPKVMEVLENAEHHIHFEYYIYEDDEIGNQIADLLIKKAKEGIRVRFLYDDLGSKKLKKGFLNRLEDAGVLTAPVNKIKFKLFANPINYRDHRKIILVDGKHVFCGGINVADRYINPNEWQYWRDTHLYIRGNAALYFQYLFLTNWTFAKEKLPDYLPEYFPEITEKQGDKFVQTALGGPDMDPNIMMTTASAIYEAKERVYITTPYFIPVETILNAVKLQARAGLDVRIMVPRDGDSPLVNAAAYSYYGELLESNVRLFFYENGFIHSKTMLVDDHFSVVGTANMDVRSHELNFEVNAHVYDREINKQLYEAFLTDMENCVEITSEEWNLRPKYKVFWEHLARLFSPLL